MTYQARLLTMAESGAFAEGTDILARARGDAANVTALAESAANEVTAKAQKEAAAFIQNAREIADDALVDYVNTATVEKTAEAFRRILRVADDVRADFDDMTPWLSELVLAAVRRILGTFDDTELTARVIDQAMSETRTRWAFAIRVHPSRQAFMQELLALHAATLSPITDVQLDPKLSPELCLLVGGGGILDVSVPTQLDGLARLLADEVGL